MNEPFFPFPIPSPPENGLGAILSGPLGRLSARLRGALRGWGESEPRLATGSASRRKRGRERRFPVLPPPEF